LLPLGVGSAVPAHRNARCSPRAQLGAGRGVGRTHTHTRTHKRTRAAHRVPRAFVLHTTALANTSWRGVRGTRSHPHQQTKQNKSAAANHHITSQLISHTRIKQHNGSAAARRTCMQGDRHCVSAPQNTARRSGKRAWPYARASGPATPTAGATASNAAHIPQKRLQDMHRVQQAGVLRARKLFRAR
jgi:hypothetical protein